MSAPLKAMRSNLKSFADKAEIGVSKAERLFRKVTPALGEAQKQFMQFATAAAIAGVVLGGIKFGFKSLTDYEDALASFRTIVSNLSDKEFTRFQAKIEEVANATDASTVQVAQSFEKIAGLNSKFAETAEGLGAVSEAAVILSRASRDELGSSAESLVGIMNQFSLAADQANRTINVLAAGQAVGASSIKQTADAFTTFGSTAAGANITLEQSVALVQTLGKFSIFGSEAGTQLKGSILQLQRAGVGYKSGLFNINDALGEVKNKFDKLRTAKEKDAYLTNTFGAINIGVGRILVGNTKLFNDYTDGVTGTSEAQKAAAINSATFSQMVERLKNKFINWITTSEEAKSALEGLRKFLGFIGDNFKTIIKVASWFIGIMLTIKTVLLVARGAITLYAIGTKIAAAAQWLWNAAMSANPIGLIIIGVAALSVAIYKVVSAYKRSNTAAYVHAEVQERVLEKTIDQRVEATLLFQALKRTTEGTKEYNDILEKIDKIQPGIVDKYNLQTKAIGMINAAEKELIGTIMKRAEAEARGELLREKTKAMLENKTTDVGFWESILYGSEGMAKLQRQLENNNLNKEIEQLASDQANAESTPALNPKKNEQDALLQKIEVSQKKGAIDININDPTGKASVSKQGDFLNVKTTSTMAVPTGN